jgi:hypothetical protein
MYKISKVHFFLMRIIAFYRLYSSCFLFCNKDVVEVIVEMNVNVTKFCPPAICQGASRWPDRLTIPVCIW